MYSTLRTLLLISLASVTAQQIASASIELPNISSISNAAPASEPESTAPEASILALIETCPVAPASSGAGGSGGGGIVPSLADFAGLVLPNHDLAIGWITGELANFVPDPPCSEWKRPPRVVAIS